MSGDNVISVKFGNSSCLAAPDLRHAADRHARGKDAGPLLGVYEVRISSNLDLVCPDDMSILLGIALTVPIALLSNGNNQGWASTRHNRMRAMKIYQCCAQQRIGLVKHEHVEALLRAVCNRSEASLESSLRVSVHTFIEKGYRPNETVQIMIDYLKARDALLSTETMRGAIASLHHSALKRT